MSHSPQLHCEMTWLSQNQLVVSPFVDVVSLAARQGSHARAGLFEGFSKVFVSKVLNVSCTEVTTNAEGQKRHQNLAPLLVINFQKLSGIF